MAFSIRKCALLIAVVYCIFSLFSTLSLWKAHSIGQNKDPSSSPVSKSPVINVEVWGKSSISQYLWSHILKGTTRVQDDESVIGNVIAGNFNLTYRSGSTITPQNVPSKSKFIVLVLNGMPGENKQSALLWLEAVRSGSIESVEKVILLMLGDEECRNEWLYPYMSFMGGPVNAAFLVYDTLMVDELKFFQWPLGVATHRNFPDFIIEDVDILIERPYLCNFMATIYTNSSRERLAHVLDSTDLGESCYMKKRNKWSPTESPESLNDYIQVLMDSDLTLSPVGQNSECYRIFEALSVGSIPVVEDVMTPGSCDNTTNSPLRLLKRYKAPLIYIKSWKSDLVTVLESEKKMSLQEKIARRATAINWYTDFRSHMRNQFLHVMSDTFSDPTISANLVD